jgi:outer membrane lipoprotein SlyB
MKKQVMILASLLAASHGVAFAHNTDHAAVQFSSAEAQQLFEQDAQPLQVAELSHMEMKKTEGAFGPWGAAGGALVGGIGNVGYQLGAGRGWSWGSFGYAVGSGALTGFSGGAAAWYVVPRVAFFGGITAGRLGW